MELEIKTVSFGGYDKKATETYFAELNKKHEEEVNRQKEEIAKLKEDATKLSEAVKGLKQT